MSTAELDLSNEPSSPRSVVTSGYSTVDVIVNGVVEAAPGGTAVNVAAALSTLGWAASVVGTVGADPAGDFLSHGLRDSGVSTSHLVQDDRWTTPVVLQERHRGDHVWKFSCPDCGARFAKHRPSSAAYATQLLHLLEAPDVFVFDRTSLFAIELARAWSQAGTLVVFEPAGVGRPALFDRAAQIADVVKYSSERGPAFEDRLPDTSAVLVRTLGAAGAEYKIGSEQEWTHLQAPTPVTFVDTAGAGDWTTAGFVDALVPFASVRRQLRSSAVSEALQAGQQLGATACTWEGVRPERPLTLQRDAFESFACPRVTAEQKRSDRPLPIS